MLLRKKLSKKPYINFCTNAIKIAENKNKNRKEFSYGSDTERKRFMDLKNISLLYLVVEA